MRTTIDLKESSRARLLQLAAERGEKGFSSLVNEAVDEYLTGVGKREEARRRALDLQGELSGEEGEELRRSIKQLRRTWR